MVIKLPAVIEAEMKLFRLGMASLPSIYVNFHHTLAQDDLALRIQDHDWKLLEKIGLVNDGFGDDMKYLTVIVAIKDKTNGWGIHTLKWHESGAWFKQEPSGGFSRFANMIVNQ